MKKNQYTMQDPVKQYPKIAPPKQRQPEPGLDSKMKPLADGKAHKIWSGHPAGSCRATCRARIELCVSREPRIKLHHG